VEGLLLVLCLLGTNSLTTKSSLSQEVLEFSTLNTSGIADILKEDVWKLKLFHCDVLRCEFLVYEFQKHLQLCFQGLKDGTTESLFHPPPAL